MWVCVGGRKAILDQIFIGKYFFVELNVDFGLLAPHQRKRENPFCNRFDN